MRIVSIVSFVCLAFALTACGARSDSGGHRPTGSSPAPTDPASPDPAPSQPPTAPDPAPSQPPTAPNARPAPVPPPATPDPEPTEPEPEPEPMPPEPEPVREPTPGEVSEVVTCVFQGSSTPQECYSGSGIGAGCKGKGSCSMVVTGPWGLDLTWKSTCGGYAYTILDGNNEPAVFACGATTP